MVLLTIVLSNLIDIRIGRAIIPSGERMKFEEKIKKELSAKKISSAVSEFAKKVDNLRKISKKTSVSFSAAALAVRRGK